MTCVIGSISFLSPFHSLAGNLVAGDVHSLTNHGRRISFDGLEYEGTHDGVRYDQSPNTNLWIETQMRIAQIVLEVLLDSSNEPDLSE